MMSTIKRQAASCIFGIAPQIKDIINSVEPICDNKIIETVPTRHGYHLITKPFNKKAFYEKYNSSIDIHDNNPTVLYVNLKDDENE